MLSSSHPIFEAIDNDAVKTVAKLAKKITNLKIKNDADNTPIAHAAATQRWQCLKVILQHVNGNHTKNLQLSSALLDCVKYQHSDGVDTLIALNAAKNSTVHYIATGFSALHVAVINKNPSMVNKLLEASTDPSVPAAITEKNSIPITPLELAVKSNQVAIAKILLSNGANQNVYNLDKQLPIEYAAVNKQWEMVECCLGFLPKALISQCSITLKIAVDSGQDDLVKKLLEKNISPNTAYRVATGFFAIHEAIDQKNLPLLNLLLEHHANPSLRSEITKQNTDEITPLELAIKKNLPKAIRMLAESEAEISITDNRGLTLIEQAATAEHWECADELLKLDYFKENAAILGKVLTISTTKNNTEFSKKLVANGAKLENYDANGYAPLHIMAKNNNIELTHCLLDAKANPNIMTTTPISKEEQKSALQIAVEYKHYSMIRLLDADKDKPKQIVEKYFSEMISFYQTYNNLEQTLQDNAHLNIEELSKTIVKPSIMPLFDFAEIIIYLKKTDAKKFAFVKHKFEFFKNTQALSHPYIAKALLAILRETFEANDSLTTPTKTHLYNILKLHKPSEEKSEGSLDTTQLRITQAATCTKLAKRFYKDTIDEKLLIRVSQIAASEYLQEMARIRNHEAFDKNRLILLFGKSVFRINWRLKKSALSNCILEYIQKYKQSNRAIPHSSILMPSLSIQSDRGENPRTNPSMMYMYQQFNPSAQSLSLEDKSTTGPQIAPEDFISNQYYIPTPPQPGEGGEPEETLTSSKLSNSLGS